MLVSGVLVTAFGAGSWWYARQQLARNLDLRITEAARRLWTQLTPRYQESQFADAVSATFGQSMPAISIVIQSHAGDHPVLLSSDHGLNALAGDVFAAHLPSGESVVTRSAETETPQRQGRAQSAAVAAGGAQRRPQMPEIREPVFFSVSNGDGDWRFGAFSNPHYTVFAGVSARDFFAESGRAAWLFSSAGAASLLLAGLGAWWASGRAIRPLDRVVATAEKLEAGKLDQRIELRDDDDREFVQLISALNGMTERLQASFQQAARFTADASHELKTPLAVMQSTLQETLRELSPEDPLRERLDALFQQTSRLKHITHSLLLLSQADAGKLPVNRARYDLSADLAGLIEDAESLCEQAGLSFQKDITPGIEIEADPALMQQVFRNLLSNAIKYNRPHGSVIIRLSCSARGAVFAIENTGASIPEAVRSRVFERFFRSDAARNSDGFGLGLNIAFELARANGAELRLVPPNEALTVFSITIPQASTFQPAVDSAV